MPALRARPLRAHLPLLLALGGLAACGGSGRDQRAQADSTPPAPPPAEARACTLVGIPELERITGASLAPGAKTEDYQGYSRCDWTRRDSPFVALVVNQRGEFGTYLSVPGAQPLSGVGRDAVWNPRTQQLAVQLDTGTMSVNFLSAPFEKKWAELIAQAALAGLKAASSATSQ